MNVPLNTIIAALRFAQLHNAQFRNFAAETGVGPIYNESGLARLAENPRGDTSTVVIEVEHGNVAKVFAPRGTEAVIIDHGAQMDLRRAVDVAVEHGLDEARKVPGPVRRYGRAAAGRPRRIFWGAAA